MVLCLLCDDLLKEEQLMKTVCCNSSVHVFCDIYVGKYINCCLICYQNKNHNNMKNIYVVNYNYLEAKKEIVLLKNVHEKLHLKDTTKSDEDSNYKINFYINEINKKLIF